MHTNTTPPMVIRTSPETEGFISATEAHLSAAFTEWDRRYREEPERFMSEATRLLKETPESYGAAAAPYLIALLSGKV